MIAYTYVDERDNTTRSFQIQVFRMRIGDGIAVNEDRVKLAEQYAGNDILLTTLYPYPLLKHSSAYSVGATPDSLEQKEFTQDDYLSLPEELAEQWYAAVLEQNPQHGISQLDYLKKVLAGMTSKNDSTSSLSSGEPSSS